MIPGAQILVQDHHPFAIYISDGFTEENIPFIDDNPRIRCRTAGKNSRAVRLHLRQINR